MLNFLKRWDLNGKPITFYFNTSTVHKTIFGGILSITSFISMMSITIITLINYIYQRPEINSNIVYYINKKFFHLEHWDIKGKLKIENNEDYTQLNEFSKYFRVAFYEKNEYDSLDNLIISKFDKINNMQYSFSFKIPINDIFKEKEFSVLKIMSCAELRKYDFAIWDSEEEKQNCNDNYENYFHKNYPKKTFTISFYSPIYSIDTKGNLQKTEHTDELSFIVNENIINSYLTSTKFIILEDNSNIYYKTIKYEAYIVFKNFEQIKRKSTEGYSLEIHLENQNSEQLTHIKIYKYKLMDWLATLGGIMKIITLMKMSCKFWSSYFYERSLYRLVVTRKNKYLDEKRAIIESSFSISKNDYYNNSNNHIIQPNNKISFNFNIPPKTRINYPSNRYTSYRIWFGNRFCKCFYLNKEAKQKRMMLCEILGLDNYLLHLDYIDKHMLLEQTKNNNVGKSIREINNNYNNYNKNIETDTRIITPKSQRNKNSKYFQLISE